MKTISEDEVAKLCGWTVRTLRNRIAADRPVPPYCQPPESRRRIWFEEDVVKWVRSHTSQPATIVKAPEADIFEARRRNVQRRFGMHKSDLV